uniref:TPR-containing protein DDB_G0280363-like n=1 Tax=Dermatophagoides pteronyssinus TaxID=6956 RepID=A0A6P6YAX6_DERPT|nr:TPR-containing protein DDB_G0280363-like [Dermatophagoides pteronyssinus]
MNQMQIVKSLLKIYINDKSTKADNQQYSSSSSTTTASTSSLNFYLQTYLDQLEQTKWRLERMVPIQTNQSLSSSTIFKPNNQTLSNDNLNPLLSNFDLITLQQQQQHHHQHLLSQSYHNQELFKNQFHLNNHHHRNHHHQNNNHLDLNLDQSIRNSSNSSNGSSPEIDYIATTSPDELGQQQTQQLLSPPTSTSSAAMKIMAAACHHLFATTNDPQSQSIQAAQQFQYARNLFSNVDIFNRNRSSIISQSSSTLLPQLMNKNPMTTAASTSSSSSSSAFTVDNLLKTVAQVNGTFNNNGSK